MVVDTEWDQKVWKEAWEPRDEPTVPEDMRDMKSQEREPRWRSSQESQEGG